MIVKDTTVQITAPKAPDQVNQDVGSHSAQRNYSRYELWYGRDEAPAEPRLLTAGPVTALFEGGDLRYVKIRGLEVVRRLYVSARDANWNTIPGELRQLDARVGRDDFQIRIEVRHQRAPIDFRFHGEITGEADGTIRYSMEGEALSSFRYNRIGFCLLHPPQASAGKPYVARTPASEVGGHLPSLIGPQRLQNGVFGALFPPFNSLAIEIAANLTAQFAFEGDLFETEDHRNWTDASFKTYCTPLALPFPFDAKPGQHFKQSVTCSFAAKATRHIEVTPEPTLTLGKSLGRKLPAIGLGMASHGQPLSEREQLLLRGLKLNHLRVDLHLAQSDWRQRFQQAMAVCQQLSCRMELALFVTDEAQAELNQFTRFVKDGSAIARFLVFHEREERTAARWVQLARERLRAVAPEALFVSGTNIYFCELNRNRPELDALDAVAYSINPQVHAFDETSIVETLSAQAETIHSARAFCGDRPLLVTPITLKRRFNPSATGPERELRPGELPPQVDARQMSLFAAAWTAGSVKQLAEAGAASLTYYETSGWQGVIERDDGPSLPKAFLSERGTAFPVYHVIADLGEWPAAELMDCSSSHPLVTQALAVRAGQTIHFLLANLTPREQRVALHGIPAEKLTARSPDDRSALLAMRHPDRFRSIHETQHVSEGQLTLSLPAYATVRLNPQQ